MLQALVRDSRLTPKERKAFEGMIRTTAGGRKLSPDQRNWVHDTFVKYGFEGKPSPEVEEVPESSLPYERMPRPTKPPGRK